MRLRESFLTAIFSTCLLSGAFAADAAKIAEVKVFPQKVSLTTTADSQIILVQGTEGNGLTRDLTASAEWKVADPTIVKIEANRLLPLKDGETSVAVTAAGKTVTIPVTVQQAAVDRPISFRQDVMPVFMKAGCNMGSCHGAARGKDGFRLSLFGFDPEGDYQRITREISGRRINLAIPEESLLITKSLGYVPHTGGTRFDEDTEYNKTLVDWIAAGAQNDKGEVAAIESVDLYPPTAVIDGEGETQSLSVVAHYSDGTTRDVTSLAYFMTNNDNSASVSQEGVVTGHARGEAFIMARFGTHTVGSHFIVLPKGLEYEEPQLAEANYIDTHINAKLKKLRILPSEVCTDEEFLRRATLDIIGRLPTLDEYRAFMDDTTPSKREKLVDNLLDSKEFVELWVMKWAELLQIRTSREVSYKAMLLYFNWLQERVANNMPMDQLVRELLSASGGTFANPATNYYENERDTLKTSENVAQVFMGMRIQCAQCHNHPFDRWTVDDYYSFAAFFSQIGRKNAEDPRERIIYNRGSGEVQHLVTKKAMAPKFLGGDTPDVKGKDRRVVLANWLASDENPYFARNLANIVWAHFLGRGIIDQVDDVRVSNPPVNEELLSELAKRFSAYDYDFKKLVKDIAMSNAYQRSTQANETNVADSTNFSHGSLRRIRAEVLLDSISQVTETRDKFRGLPLGARAVQISDGNTSSYFLTAFGRATRETVCSCEVKVEPNLSQALHLLNGSTVNGKISQGKYVQTRLSAGAKPEEILEELYIKTLTRKPTEDEVAKLMPLLADEASRQQTLEDIFWALLNSREFLFNH